MKPIANALSRSIAVLGFAILLTTYGVSFAEDPSGTPEEPLRVFTLLTLPVAFGV